MSFIRCTSNPEGLYIWGDDRGCITISHCVDKPLASASRGSFVVPEKSFYRACAIWRKNKGGSKVECRGISISEEQVYLKTGRRVPPNRSIKATFNLSVKTEILVRLAYKADYVYMWLVTWEYIVNSVVCREDAYDR